MGNDAFLVNMGLRISQRRKELHLTQEKLAEKMGVSLQTISNIELGKKAIRPENLVKLCFFLEVSTDYILCGKRSDVLMNDTVAKLSELDPESYRLVQDLVRLLHSKNSPQSPCLP